MHPIATYEEARYDGKRIFELFADRLVFRGKQALGTDVHGEVSLAELNPVFDRVGVRNPHFYSGSTISGGCGLFIIFMTSGFHYEFLSDPVLIAVAFGFCGLIVMAATYRKTQFSVFRTLAGVPAVDIAQNEKQANECAQFVQKLVDQIKAARGTA